MLAQNHPSPVQEDLSWELDTNRGIIVHPIHCDVCHDLREHYTTHYAEDDQSLIDACDERDFIKNAMGDKIDELHRELAVESRRVVKVREQNNLLQEANNNLLRQLDNLRLQLNEQLNCKDASPDSPRPRKHPRPAPLSSPSPQNYIELSSIDGSPSCLAGSSRVAGEANGHTSPW
jgi:hypothetical protein